MWRGHQAPQSLEEQVGLLAFALDLRRGMRSQLRIDRNQRTAGRLRDHLVQAGAFQIVEIVVGMRNGGARHDHAVVGQEGDVLARHRA